MVWGGCLEGAGRFSGGCGKAVRRVREGCLGVCKGCL